MTGSEEETYSIMFSSLKHPARRKLLRMLSERAMTFSKMLEVLSIPSSHLTYHLENLGELVVKSEDGKYMLSSFGKAAVSMMKGAEEVPDVRAKRFSALPLRWKTLFVAFTIAILLLASMSLIQYSSFNQLLSDFGGLKEDYTKVKAENDRLLAWSSSGNMAMSIIRDVIQLDVSKYQSRLESNTVEDRADLGGVIEEVFRYSFVNSGSEIELTLKFRNSHFSFFQLNQLEGLPMFPPVYTQSQSTDNIQAVAALLGRYRSVSGDSYLNDMTGMITAASGTNAQQTTGNVKMTILSYGENAEITFQYTENGNDFSTKSVRLKSQNHIITELSDDWFLYKIGNGQVTTSREQAIQIAKEAAKNYSWNSNGTQVSNFVILDQPASAEFYPHPKANDLTLFPYWYVMLHLDKTYPGGVNVITVGVWGDTGDVSNIEALGVQT